jgi:hypothetical protein
MPTELPEPQLVLLARRGAAISQIRRSEGVGLNA